MKKRWMLAYPMTMTESCLAISGWGKITTLLEVGEISQFVEDRLNTHNVKASTLMGKDEFRTWDLSNGEFKTFREYIGNNVGIGELKLRMEIQEK